MIKKRLIYFFAVALFSPLFLPEAFPAPPDTNIRVCVSKDKEEVIISVKGPYTIEATNGRLLLDKGREIRDARITPTPTGVMMGDKEFKIYGIRIIPKNDADIYVNGTRLRGIVDVIREKNFTLSVVNHLDVEKYLLGVLYHEVPHYWPMETLKAQAVVARTFALYRKEIMRERDYDVTSDIYSQVYGGKKSERRRSTKAVRETSGKVLSYGKKILPAYYHSICGGHTEDAAAVFEISLAPLRGVACPYCKGARGEHWKASFSYKQMEERLNKYGIKVKGMNFIAEGGRNRSGRLETVKIKDSNGPREIKAFKFRLALGPNVIRSADFTIDITKKGVIFKGKGWGHGVGMCQWGAFGMGKRRFHHEQILEFYYPGSKIVYYDEVI